MGTRERNDSRPKYPESVFPAKTGIQNAAAVPKKKEDMSATGPKVWILAGRPKTLPAAAAPVIMGTALAWGDALPHWPSALCALLGAILIQVGTNYANDYFDFAKGTDTAERIGPTRATQAGLVSPTAMLIAMVLAFGLALVPGAYLIYRGGIPILVVGVLAIACGVLYTGGPYPLGYLGIADIFVVVFFGPVAVAGTYYVQTQDFDMLPVIAGLSPGLFSMAILTVNNLRDVVGDGKTGKRTLAVRFGPTFAKMEYLLSILVAALAVPIYLVWVHRDHWWALASCLTLIAALPSCWKVVAGRGGPALNETLATTGKLLLLFSILFSVGWLL